MFLKPRATEITIKISQEYKLEDLKFCVLIRFLSHLSKTEKTIMSKYSNLKFLPSPHFDIKLQLA